MTSKQNQGFKLSDVAAIEVVVVMSCVLIVTSGQELMCKVLNLWFRLCHDV